MKLRKTIVGYLLCGFFMFFLFGIFCSNLFAAYTQTYKIEQNTTTERSTLTLVGDMRINRISTATANADIIFQSSGTYPMQLYRGDLQIVTTGYGITFPDGSLQISAGVGGIVDTLSSTGTVVINSDSDNSGAESIIFRTAGATERMRMDTNGNVGIGTTNPSEKLTLNGGRIFFNNLEYSVPSALGSAGTGEHILFYNGASDKMSMGFEDGAVFISAQKSNGMPSIKFYTATDTSAPTVKMKINGDGNVGIGTTNPAQKVHIVGPTLTSAQVDWNLLLESEKIASPSDGTGIGIKFKHDTGSATKWCGIAATATDAWSNSMDLRFYTRLSGESPVAKMTIAPNGNVGIGTTEPSEKLEVNNGNIKTNYGVNAATGTFSGTITVSTITLSQATTRYYTIPACEFFQTATATDFYGILHSTPEVDNIYPVTSDVYYSIDSNRGMGSNHIAPLHLPQNAIITSVIQYFYTSGTPSTTSEIVTVLLRRTFTGNGSIMARVYDNRNLTVGYYSTEITDITDNVIDNNLNYYYLIGHCDSIQPRELLAVKITYTVTSPLP